VSGKNQGAGAAPLFTASKTGERPYCPPSIFRMSGSASSKASIEWQVLQSLGMLRAPSGVALLALAKAGIPIKEYSPLEVKQAICGYGRAEKRQVQEMVKAVLGLSERPRPDDAADALAVAICHVHSMPIGGRLEAEQ